MTVQAVPTSLLKFSLKPAGTTVASSEFDLCLATCSRVVWDVTQRPPKCCVTSQKPAAEETSSGGPFICSFLEEYTFNFKPFMKLVLKVNVTKVELVNFRLNMFTGSTGTLLNEIDAQITAKKAWKRILPGGSLGPEQVQSGINVEVTGNFSKVSIITMLAPSPDWFIGIDSVDLCNNGTWRQSWEVTMLPPWDAGTEEGLQFSGSNPATSPHVNIFQITNDMGGAFNAQNPIQSLGEFLFQKREQSTDESGTTSSTKPTDNSVGKTSVSLLAFVSSTLIVALFL